MNPQHSVRSLHKPAYTDKLVLPFPNRTGTFQCIRLSRSLLQASCTPFPCLKYYLEHLSTMGTPSPCILQCLGDPLVTLLFWSERRCLRSPYYHFHQMACFQQKRLPTLQISIDNPENRRLRFRQFSFHHIRPGCLAPKYQTFRPCYCPQHPFGILGKAVP